MRNVAAFPLAIPLLAGPGAITATVLLAGRADGDIVLHAVLIASRRRGRGRRPCLSAFFCAGRIGRLLGMTGNIVLSRLLGRAACGARCAICGRRHPRACWADNSSCLLIEVRFRAHVQASFGTLADCGRMAGGSWTT